IMEKIVIHQPHPDPVDVPNAHEWGSGICDFKEDTKSCCLGFWCCPCFACMTSKEYGECLCLPMLEFFRAWMSPITMSMRTSVRERYNIQGSIAMDCVCATFCTPCVWCQISREIQRRKRDVVLVNAKTV
uniref:Plac8 onzin related protein 2 n=2 Tax=Poecilia latipinna TaxID=48699 RepID=A0A3B3UT70_9TELE